jgi:hypothetical protein
LFFSHIKEHHELEDMLHKNREELAKLRTNLKFSPENVEVAFSERINFDEITLLEKTAEFQALDLAINNRRRHLYKLEMKKKKNFTNLNYADFNDSELPVFHVYSYSETPSFSCK